jgi:hypothetical protein
VFYVLAAALCVVEFFDVFPAWLKTPLGTGSPRWRRTFFVLGICALPLAFELQLQLFGEMERAQRLTGLAAFPFPVLDSSATMIASRDRFPPMLLVLMVIESLALWAVVRQLAAERLVTDGALTGIATLALAIAALHAPVLTSGDMYSYIGYGLLGSRAYSPPAIPFGDEFASVNALWGMPLPSAAYGPLWVAYNGWVLQSAGTLLQKIHLIQVVGLVCVIALAALLRACGLKPATCALVLLNPVMYLQFVTNGHNDILPVLLTVAAFAVARRMPYAAVPIAIAAGAMKVPFVAIGALAFVRSGSLARRLGLTAGCVIAGAIISLAFGGGAYSSALGTEVASRHTEGGLWLLRIPGHAIAAAIALTAVCVALFGRRPLWSAALTFPALSGGRFAWYGLWGLPLALQDDLLMTRFLLALPAVGFCLERAVDVTSYEIGALAAIVLLASPGVVQKVRPPARVP